MLRPQLALRLLARIVLLDLAVFVTWGSDLAGGRSPGRPARRAAAQPDMSTCRARAAMAASFAVGGDGMLYIADTHTLFATPLAGAFDPGARFRQFPLGPGLLAGSLRRRRMGYGSAPTKMVPAGSFASRRRP
jgi:hypothetical protein